MVNKSLNDSLDAHFDKLNSGEVPIKVPKEKKKKQKKERKENLLVMHLKKIKNYLFPGVQFESVDISEYGTTVVSAVDKGIKYHFKLIKSKFKSAVSKKKVEEEKSEPEDVDVSLIKDVIKHNKIKK